MNTTTNTNSENYKEKRRTFVDSFINSKYSPEIINNLSDNEKKASEVYNKFLKAAKETLTSNFINDSIYWMKDEFPKDFFKLITKMPKGGLLHAHMEVTGTPSVLLKMATP